MPIKIIQIALLVTVISCGHVNNNEQMARAKQIKITALKYYLTQLQNRQLEFDFFGITSNGTDCIYFVPDTDGYVIEYEVMLENQKPWLDKLIAFARQNNYSTIITTYNNKPHYRSDESAPLLRIETKSNLDETARIGRNIMTEVFRNNDDTVYEVVP